MGPNTEALLMDAGGGGASRRMFLRGSAAAALAIGGTAVLGACGSSGKGSSSGGGNSKGGSSGGGNRKKIGFSQPDTSAAIWAPLMSGARQAAQARGYELLTSHANSQLSGQLAEIQTWTAEGVGAIVALPLDNNAILPLIKKAHAAGIKFLDYSDNALPGVDGYVIFDNLQGAKSVGTYVGNWVKNNLGGSAEVALLTHQVQLTGRQRVDGTVKAMQAIAPGAKVVAQHEGVLSPDTFPAFQSILQAHPNINVAICIADEGCQGVLKAFEATHPSAQRVKEMLICGFDGSGPSVKDVMTGTPVRAVGALDAVAVGKAVLNAAADAIEGKGKTRINFPYELCTAKTQALDKKLLAEVQG